MPKKQDISVNEKIILATLSASQFQGWEHVTLHDIADEAQISIFELREYFDDKFDILCGLGKLIDRKTLEGVGKFDPELNVKDALFDVMMERFDVLNQYREGILAIIFGFKRDPKYVMMSAPFLCRSMSWMLESVQINTSGVKGALIVAALSGIYLKVLKVWVNDESEDMSQTMAALDKELGRAEQFANTLGF